MATALVYQVLPDAKIAWRDVWVGAGSSGLLFLLGNHVIGWYLAAAGIASVYGAVGSFVIVLLWVYCSSQVVLFGVEFTRVTAKHRGSPFEPKDNAVRVNRKGHARQAARSQRGTCVSRCSPYHCTLAELHRFECGSLKS